MNAPLRAAVAVLVTAALCGCGTPARPDYGKLLPAAGELAGDPAVQARR